MWICQNDFGFSLCAVLSMYCMVAASENWMESEIRVSADVSVLSLNTRD